MKQEMIPYVLLLILFGFCWFFFFGKSIKYDAISKSITEQKYWTSRCTWFPWYGLVYVVARHFTKRNFIKCKHPVKNKLISYLFFIIAVSCAVSFALVILHMEKIGLIAIEK